MKAQVAAAQSKVASLKPVTVFDYDSGKPPRSPAPAWPCPTPSSASAAAPTSSRGSSRAGRRCLGSRSSGRPECIIINDYGTPTAAQKEKFLETSPITKNLTAVKNRCFLPLSYDEVTPSPATPRRSSLSPAGSIPPRSACPPTAHDPNRKSSAPPTVGVS